MALAQPYNNWFIIPTLPFKNKISIQKFTGIPKIYSVGGTNVYTDCIF